MTISLPSGIFDLYFDAVDYLLEEPNIGRDATLYYDIKQSRSSNYTENFLDPQVNVKTETIKLRVYHSPKDWLTSSNIEFVDGRIQVLGYMADKNKLSRSTKVEVDGNSYRLATTPLRHGFGTRYFIAFLDLI